MHWIYLLRHNHDGLFYCLIKIPYNDGTNSFRGFQALTESNWGSKSIANFYGAENKKIIADGSRDNYIDVLSMELACIQELGIMCVYFSKLTFFILSTKTVGFRENASLKYFICIWKYLLVKYHKSSCLCDYQVGIWSYNTRCLCFLRLR